MRWLLRFALALVAVVLVFRWVARLVRAGMQPPASAPPPGRVGRMERDPICGTYVAAEISLTENVDGQTLHFCSERCRQQYRAERRALRTGSG